MLNYYFFFNDTATTEIYTLSLHDALPISHRQQRDVDPSLAEQGHRVGQVGVARDVQAVFAALDQVADRGGVRDRKSTRLNSSHANISYAVFCLKKKQTHLTKLQRKYLHTY